MNFRFPGRASEVAIPPLGRLLRATACVARRWLGVVNVGYPRAVYKPVVNLLKVKQGLHFL
jgi:hypothetical protein